MAGNKLKRLRVREAKMEDIGLVRKLWKAMMEEQYKAGSLILPNEANLDVMEAIFEMYIEKKKDGVVLLVSDAAILCYGDMVSPYELALGDRIAYGFGQYVTPEHRGRGILDLMAKEAFEQLTAMGFSAMFGTTMVEDAYGRKAFARVVEQSGLKVEDSGERPCYVKLSKE